jgi:hypothetical protein
MYRYALLRAHPEGRRGRARGRGAALQWHERQRPAAAARHDDPPPTSNYTPCSAPEQDLSLPPIMKFQQQQQQTHSDSSKMNILLILRKSEI